MKHRKTLWKSCVLMLWLWTGYILQGGQVSHQPRKANAGTVLAAKPAVSCAKLPLSFQADQGQKDESVKFLSHGRRYGLFLTGDEAVLTLNSLSSIVRGPSPSRGRGLYAS